MGISLKRLTENELELMMNWRMREDISKYLATTVSLTLAGQKEWFAKIQNDMTQIRWVIFADETPIGSMYIVDVDYKKRECESGWFIAEKKHMSFAQVVSLQRNLNDFVFDILGLQCMYGYVLEYNTPVINMMRLFGSEKQGVLKDHVNKEGKTYSSVVFCITADQWMEKKKKMRYEYIEIER